MQFIIKNPDEKKVLEVGCSQGELLKKFKDVPGWKATGLDYGGDAVRYAQSLGFDAHISDIQSMNFPNESFNAVVAIHTLEHVQDLIGFINEVNRVIKMGGYFFAVMPSTSHYKPRRAGARWKYWGPPGHLWYFSNRSLSLFLEKHGFEIKHCSSFYHRAHVRVLAKKINNV